MKSYTSIHDPKDLLTYEFLTKSLGVKKYDETATYSKGALVYHEDATDTYLDSIFEANQDIATAESWTAAHWDTVDLETIIKRSMHLYEPYMEYDGSIAKEVIYMEKCVIFSGSSAFDLGLVDEKWYGTNLDKSKTGSLEISTDKKTWETWDYKAKGADLQSNGKYEVYVRGKGNNNTCDNATPNPNYSTFTTTAPVNLIGKLDWIIDYTAASPVCGDCSNLFGKVGGSPAKIVDASGFTLSANLDPAAALADFFQDCTTLTTPPTLPAIQISEGCYYGFFIGCTSLKTAPELPATSVAKDCYRDMFVGCTSLTTAPELPAMDLSGCKECYDAMFRGCISLTTAPELPATTIAELCYNQMFQECEKLTTAPSTLPAEDLTGCNSCYTRMFAGCLALETAPTLPATQLVDNCYQEMFDGCIALKTCPELACTNLAENCYEKMFQGCVALTAPCELPAETLFQECYRWMFNNCTSITWTTDTSANAYIIPTSGSGTAPTGTPWNEDMFAGNSGTLPGTEASPSAPGTPQINHTYYYGTAAPGEDPAGTFTFYNLEHKYPKNDVVITNTLYSTSNIEYSIDGGSTWTTLANGSSTPAAGEVKIRGDIVTFDSGGRSMYPLTITGTRVAVKGQLEDSKDYKFLFIDCAALVDASGLRGAATLAEGCYSSMFQCCEALITPPTLPATTLPDYCYSGMFEGCISLTTAPELPATTLAECCYEGIFYSCASLTTVPALPATELASWCYGSMFAYCTSLTTAPELPATTLAEGCYDGMFENCVSLTTAPELPATTLAEGCYNCMFQNCAMLSLDVYGRSYELPAETMYTECYQFMFAGCTSLTETPCILAKTAADSCFESMFKGCTSLTMVNGGSSMDLTSVGEESCAGMFEGCISLANVDTGLLAKVNALSGSLCFMGMFKDCILFNTTLELPPVTTLTRYCYQYMFCNCKSLTIPPTLPDTTLAEGCYQYMFSGCAHIRKCPELPATTLTGFCYEGMFTNCVSLTEPCALPAIELTSGCYKEMFSGCTGIEFASSGTAYRIPTTGTSTTVDPDKVRNMFANCSGTLPGSEKTTPTPGTPQINTTYYIKKAGDMNKYEPYMEYDGSTAKEVVHMDKCVIFTSSNTFNLQLTGNKWYGEGTLEYSTNKKDWTQYPNDGTATLPTPVQQANGKYELYLRGKGNTHTYSSSGTTQFTSAAADRFDIIGNFDWLLDYTSSNVLCGECDDLFRGIGVVDASGLVMSKNFSTSETLQYYELFRDCTSLIAPPQLPATTLVEDCYKNMFYYCESLKTAPELPATTLPARCYYDMFANCISLTTAPKLPATTLADECYREMFMYCSALETPPALTAINLAESCYCTMFYGCTSLTTAPELPATTLADYCYQDMFNSCTSLTTLPKLSATTMKKGCYNCMFQDCTGITWGATGTPYRLPATGTGTTASSWNEDMFAGNSGTLPGSETGGEGAGTPSIDTTYYYNPQPEEFVRKGKEYMEVNSGTAPIIGFAVDSNGVLTFTRGSIEYVTHIDKSVIFTSPNTFNLQLSGNAWHGDGTLEYSTDGYTWETYGTTNATTLPAPKLQDNGKYELYLRGKGNTTTISGSGDTTQFTTNSTDRINIKGSLDTLLNCTSTPTTTSIQSLFEGVNIVDASELVMPTNYNSATGKNSHCAMLFKNCTHLTGAPQFPNVTLAEACYRNMFQGCTALTTPPQLPATQLAKSCYQYMFHGSGLTSAPTLPATTLISNCYNSMFRNCGSLTTPPALPAMSLDVCCYSYMFENSGLTTTPVLPATTIGAQSYEHMFQNCTALTAAPALPATTLGQQCYEGMFLGCTGITKIPALPATTISTYGYRQMFEGCTGLKFYPVGTSASESFTIPSTTTVGTSALEYMFRNCTDFPETGGTPVQGTVYGYGDKLPDPYITIETTDGSDFGIQMVSRVSDVDLTKLEWSTDGTTWNEPGAAGPAIAFPVDSEGSPIYVKKVYVRGNGFTHFTSDSGYTRTMTMFCKSSSEYVADPVIKISGELRYLYDKSGEATCGNAGFLFAPLQMGPTDVQAVISDVSELVFPTKLGTDANNGLFAYMFSIPSSNCSQPITQPPQLPATQLTESCYCYMFNGCTSLTAPPELPATQLAPWCYYQMFTGCTGLTSAPALPALTVPSGAYIQMFDGCTSLTTPPATLPATTIEIDNTLTVEGYGDGYEWMFCNCPLTTIPTMPPSITINRTGEYTEETSPLAFYQMFQSNNPSLDFAGTDKSWTCPTIADTSGAANLSNMFEGQTNTDIGHGFADGDGTAVAGRTYSYTNV